MEARQVILTIAPAAWCDQAAAMLATTIRGAPCYSIDDMREEIARGGATLYSATTDAGELAGFVVLRVELYRDGAEGVLVAAAGKLAGARMYAQVLPAIEGMFRGVRSIRVEACRRGAVRELRRSGYLPTHAIMRKVVAPARVGDDTLEALQACNVERGGPDLRARPGKLHGGGGGSSSSSSNQTTNNVDRRLVADGGSIGISGDSSSVAINTTTLDGGAIEKAFAFATAGDQETGRTLNSVLGIAANVFDRAAGAVDRAASDIETANARAASQVAVAYDNAKGSGDQKTYLAAAALAVVAIVAIQVLKK